MGSLLHVLLPLAICLVAVNARLPRHVTGLRGGRTIRDRMFERITGVAANAQCPTFKEDYWKQPKDHFDPKNTDTWQQYYQTNDKFFDKTKKDKPIIFLLLGGEGPIEAQWVCWENYTYMELAKQYGALVIQNEHRFFQADAAKSGWPDMKTSTLKLLTTEQAMADTAAFIDGYNTKNGFTNAVWVGFGGSYPGTIAALMRVFYPNATAGNIASSAPLYPKVDFFEYTEVMVNTIRSTDQNCYNNVKDAFAKVYAMTKTTAGQTKLKNQFQTTTGNWDNILDVQNFMGDILGGFQEIIQYTYDARNSLTDTSLTIQYICKNFLNKAGDAPEVKLYNVFNFFEKANDPTFDGKMGDFSYAGGIAEIQNTDIASGAAADRGWMWLSCNEYGWLQSTDLQQDNIFGNILPLSFYLQMCTDLFDDPQTPFNQGDIFARVEASHVKFGDPDTYSATNVVLPNGALDPWHALGVNRSIDSQHQKAVLTQGAAHCSDMYPAYKGEPTDLEATRTTIRAEVCHFILNAGGAIPQGAPCFGQKPDTSPATVPTTTTGVTSPKPSDQSTKGATGAGLSAVLMLLTAFLLKI